MLRIQYPGALYRVTARGAGGRLEVGGTRSLRLKESELKSTVGK